MSHALRTMDKFLLPNVDCAACKQTITGKSWMTCVDCEATYHPICVNALSSDVSKIREWRCPTCRASEPKVGNQNSPAITRDRHVSPSTNNTGVRAHKRPALASPDLSREGENDTVTDIASELRLLRLDMIEIKSCLITLTEGMATCTSRMDTFDSRIKYLEERDSIVSSLREEVHQLKEQLNYQAQSNLNKEFEILGVSESLNENLEHIAMVAATKMGVNLPENDIDCAFRAGPKIYRNDGKENFPRPIIVRLTRKTKRDEMMKAVKVRRHFLTTTDLNIAGTPHKIYINEHLSKANRQLFREARKRAKDSGYRFCWVSNGRIHLRKEEGKSAIPINNQRDLDRVLPSCTSESQISAPTNNAHPL